MTRPTEQQLRDWRFQCEERQRRWANHKATPEWHLDVAEALSLLDEIKALGAELVTLREERQITVTADPDNPNRLLFEMPAGAELVPAPGKRHGPLVSVNYSCNGCAFLLETPADYRCVEPRVIEKYECAQHIGQSPSPIAPSYICPYVEAV